MDGLIDGLDVIDFPGVDDRDESIPGLATLLLTIAQVVVFVVDYRLDVMNFVYAIFFILIFVFSKAHTESAKKWLELLREKSVPFLVCLTHADKLYAENMHEDGSHPEPAIIKEEIRKEKEVSIDPVLALKLHFYFFLFHLYFAKLITKSGKKKAISLQVSTTVSELYS